MTTDMPRPNRRSVTLGLIGVPLTGGLASATAARPAAKVPAGTRQSINSGWRFTIGDPTDAQNLIYDVRPVVTKSEDGKAADAPPEAATAVADKTSGVLKPWILPTANAFIRDPAQHHIRPEGNPGQDVSYIRPAFDDRHWESVTLPHDWAIKGPFLTDGPYGGMGRLKTWGPAWYRRSLDISAGDADKSIFLDIDGAMSYAVVWLNGALVGGWPYGYASWRVDLTPYVKPGQANQLVIRLDNPPESARWYPGAGLYRNVWLTKSHRVHIDHWGVFARTPQVSAAQARVELDVTVKNDGIRDVLAEVATRIFVADADGRPTGGAVATIPAARMPLRGGQVRMVTIATEITKPRLWGPLPHQTPNRYCAVTEVRCDGKVTDTCQTVFGIRSIRFDADKGVIVNDQPVPLYGTNNHHDLGALGAAFNRRAAERQLQALQEMGCNALRMSHNPPAPELLDLADSMGFLVIDEVFDCWYRKKTPLDFHLIFPDWHEADLRAMIRRDRNHPSVILWSVGNEVGEQYTDEEGAKIGRALTAIAHEEDSSRPTMTAMNYAKADMPLPATVDVISLNYQGAGVRAAPGQFPAFRAKFPDKVILSSESASALSSRSAYQFPVPGTNSAAVRPGVGGDQKTKQVSAYELFAADFGTSADRSWAAQDQYPYVAGEFVWTGWDYLGEPTPYYEARSSYSGIIDLAGFPKDRFYLYQARWRPDLPMAHLLPHWTWPGREGEVTPVHLFTSGDEAELFVNGKSQGRKKRGPYEYRLRWDYVTYEAGELSVIAYKQSKEWARTAVRTAGAPAALKVSADRVAISADGRDLSFVTVSVVDDQGLPVPQASNDIRFRIEGGGEIVATDNGDPTNMESFASTRRNAFNGLCLAILRSGIGQRGAFTLLAESPGLKGASVKISTI